MMMKRENGGGATLAVTESVASFNVTVADHLELIVARARCRAVQLHGQRQLGIAAERSGGEDARAEAGRDRRSATRVIGPVRPLPPSVPPARSIVGIRQRAVDEQLTRGVLDTAREVARAIDAYGARQDVVDLRRRCRRRSRDEICRSIGCGPSATSKMIGVGRGSSDSVPPPAIVATMPPPWTSPRARSPGAGRSVGGSPPGCRAGVMTPRRQLRRRLRRRSVRALPARRPGDRSSRSRRP